MKTLLATTAIAAVFALAGPASAQLFQPLNPPPPVYQYQPMAPTQMNEGMVQPMQRTTTTSTTTIISGTPSWMQDDGSSSDHPVHMPGDQSGDGLNAQYQGGIPTTPGHGFPAYPR
jgi:hypothetical protein